MKDKGFIVTGFKNGDVVKVRLSGSFQCNNAVISEARICIFDGVVWICHNNAKFSGGKPPEGKRFGFRFGWNIGEHYANDDKGNKLLRLEKRWIKSIELDRKNKFREKDG